MRERISTLRKILKIQRTIGLVISIVIGFVVALNFSGSYSFTLFDFLSGLFLGFFISAIPFVLLPILAIRELRYYSKNKKVVFNYIYSALMVLTIFLPVSIYQIYNLIKLQLKNKKYTNNYIQY